MQIERVDFDGICYAHLKELLDNEVPESLRLDYKRDVYGGKDGDKKEACADVCAFANAQSGHLILGVEEENATPSKIVGIDVGDPDTVTHRLDQMFRDGIEPRIQGIRIKHIPMPDNKYCVVVRVSPSSGDVEAAQEIIQGARPMQPFAKPVKRLDVTQTPSNAATPDHRPAATTAETAAS